MDFSYFLKVWLRSKWLIIGLTIIAIITAFVLLMFKKNLYESVAQYSTGFTTERVRLVDGTSAFDVYGADIKFNNVIETFKSPKVIGALSYSLLLHDLNSDKPYRVLTNEKKNSKAYKAVNTDTVKRILRDKITQFDILNSTDNTEVKVIDFLKLYNYDYASIIKYLSVNRVEGTDYLNVLFRSENPQLSATVVNTIGLDFINYYRSLTEQRGEASADVIRILVANQQHKVDSLNDLLFKAKVKQGTIDPVSRSTSAMETVKELETQLAEATTNYNVATQRLNYYNQRKKELTAGTNAPSSNDEIIKLQDQRRMLINRNSQDPAIKKQIDDLTIQIASKSSNTVNASKNVDELQKVNDNINETEATANAARKTISDLNGKIKLYTGMTNENPGSGVTVSAIQSQLDIENKALGSIQEKLTQAVGLLKENPAENIKQTLVGQPAVEPEPAKKMFTMGLAGISTFFVASLFVLFLSILDPSIKSPSQFSKIVKKPLLTSIIHLNMKEGHAADIILDDNVRADEKVKLFRQNLRKLRFELENSGKKIFLITSAKQKEGKSTIIQALAATVLLSNKRVLMVDANFSHNSLSRIFNAETKLEKLQYAHAGYEENNGEMVSHTQYKGLDIIGNEGGNYTPDEVLKRNNILEHLKELNAQYDYILIEGAAINDHSDTWELTKYVDGVIMVFSANSSVGAADNQSFTYMDNQKTKVLGAVLNNVQPENIDV
ncbi:MAG TPA: AAA family ATPase [Flavisolibacter sp.]|nr:AAA family ATPase [Flavisolibacter sp.]